MKALVIEIIDEAKDIKSFRLKPEEEMKFVAGQWMYVRLTPELKHHFTISSSPTEKGYLQFTTKFREESDYKKLLWNLNIDAEVEITGPFGSFTLNEADASSRIFLAGGIGITPFRSQIKCMIDKQLNLPTVLLYSGKMKPEMAFAKELEELQSPGFKCQIIETEKEGRVNEGMIRKYCPAWEASTLWICGPPTMVEDFVEMGQKMGFPPERIKSEEFTGY